MPARPKHLGQGSLDLVGQVSSRSLGHGSLAQAALCGLADRPAVPALNFTEPADQVNTAAHLAPV